MTLERTAFRSAHHSGQRTRRFPSTRPLASASYSLPSPWPSPLSRSRLRIWARTWSATIAVPCAFPPRAAGRRVPVSASHHQSSVFSAFFPRRNTCFVILPSVQALSFPLFSSAGPPSSRPQTVRQRDTFIPSADNCEAVKPPPFSISLSESIASAPPAHGMKIALFFFGKLRPQHPTNAHLGGFREKDRPHARTG